MKVVYLSPKIAGGIELGASYTPSTTNSDNMPATGGDLGNGEPNVGRGCEVQRKNGWI